MLVDVLRGMLLPALVGIALSFLIERLLQPGTSPPWQRPLRALIVHIGIWLLFFSFELAVFQRPWFAAAVVSAFLLFVVLVSNAKFHALREPFVFQDFEYFTDALRHPRLYLPFLGLTRTLVALLVFALALYGGIRIEPALTHSLASSEFVAALVFFVLLGIALLWGGAASKLPTTFEPVTDLWRLGLIASLWRYAEAEREPPPRMASPYDNVAPARLAAGDLPTLVVVQSESFFDPRRLFSGIRRDLLKEFDAIEAAAICHGQVQVPAWGANTVRTEFAFLAGLAGESIGVHRFNPYRKLARQGIPTLARFLQRMGYRTVCVHPYPASFYARNKVYPLLGFDELIDIRHFEGAEKTGPYIGDIALAEKVCRLLAPVTGKPIFVFVITMENHGPLHLEKVRPGDAERLYSSPPPAGCDDLTIYLRHLRNADRMAGMLRDRLVALPGPACLCWFGDHVPIMPAVYVATGEPQGQTDYFIWSKEGCAETGRQQDLKIENLGVRLLQEMGLINVPAAGTQSHSLHATSL